MDQRPNNYNDQGPNGQGPNGNGGPGGPKNKSSLLVLAVGFAVTAPKKPGEPSELKEVLQEAAEAMSLDKETMEKEVEQAVSAFEENIGAEELDGGEKQ